MTKTATTPTTMAYAGMFSSVSSSLKRSAACVEFDSDGVEEDVVEADVVQEIVQDDVVLDMSKDDVEVLEVADWKEDHVEVLEVVVVAVDVVVSTSLTDMKLRESLATE